MRSLTSRTVPRNISATQKARAADIDAAGFCAKRGPTPRVISNHRCCEKKRYNDRYLINTRHSKDEPLRFPPAGRLNEVQLNAILSLG